MRLYAGLRGFLGLLIAVGVAAGLPGSQPSVDLTELFPISSATSACGSDTPLTSYEEPQNSGLFQTCGSGGNEFPVQSLQDGNSSTKWQSENGISPVQLNFTISEPGASLSFQGVRLAFASALPLRLYVEVRLAGMPTISTLRVFVVNASRDCGSEDNCEEYTVEEVLPDGTVIVLCPLASSTEPVEEIRLTFEGFQDHFLNMSSQYYAVYEAHILGWVADGYFVRSLAAILVEGKEGYPLTQAPFTTSTDEGLITGFSSRGFATFSLDSQTQESFGWEFPSIPMTTTYQIWLSYTHPGVDVSLTAMVTGGDQLYNARVVFKNCPPPNPCSTPLVMSRSIMSVESFFLTSGENWNVDLTLTDIDLNIDYILAVPMAFYEATAIEESDRFLDSCDFIGGSLGQGTPDEQFCLESAVQLSLDFYLLTYLCGCSEAGATDANCAVYGGQCNCIDQSDGFSRITGRRCDLCPFTTYLTTSGCADCDCVDPSESCDVATGQCSCEPLVTGRTCDSCLPNSFGEPSEGCSPCGCHLLGSQYCNDTTGECVCKPGVTGASCDICEEGWFNLSSTGCEECGCHSTGSTNSSCDDSGQCNCRPNVGGEKCSTCLPGHFFLTSSGCTPCDCSGRSDSCYQSPNVTSEPSEVCVCPAPYEGGSCQRCQSGWFVSSETGDCQQCQCNGLADNCLDGNGTCLGCRGNSTGGGCDVCIDGYYDADPSDLTLTCLPCPCSTITAVNTLCTHDTLGNPICNCRQGHEGNTCGSCSEGYFGSPPEFRCSLCDCNGNIDPSVPGSCDTETGRCIKCINNTTGDECETCAAGFYGDATTQDCQPCDCNVAGSDGSLCDSTTGQCSCLPGVNGLRCEQCLPGYWNFMPAVGCQLCVCEGSVLSGNCDVVTGECECSEGVGGRGCDFCLHGYFNFSPTDGCTPCECGVGAINGSCSSYGQCYCQPGVEGAKCDLCQPFTFDLSPSGCEPCGECEQNLKEDLEREGEGLANITEQEELLMELSQVDREGLGQVAEEADTLREDLVEIGERLEQIQADIATVNQSYDTTQETVSTIEDTVQNSLEVTFELQPVAEEVGNGIQEIYNQVQRGLGQLVDSTRFAETAQPRVASWVATAEGIADNITDIADLHTTDDYSDDAMALEAAVERANQIADQASVVRDLSQSLNSEAENLIGRLEKISDDVDITSSSIDSIKEDLQGVQSSLESSATEVYSLIEDVDTINDIIDEAQTEIESSEQLIAQTDVTAVCESVDRLSVWLGTEMSGSGTEPGGPLTPELESAGSGMGLALDDSLTHRVTRLDEGVENVGVALGVAWGVVNSAVNYSSSLQQQADMICSILSESLETGGTAVEAILNYTSSVEAIEEALGVAMETREVLEEVGRVVMGGEGEGLRRRTQQLLSVSESLLGDASEESRRTEELVSEYDSVVDVVEEAYRQAVTSSHLVEDLGHTAAQLSNVTAMTILLTSETSRFVEASQSTASAIHTSLITQLTNLRDDASAAVETVNETEINFAIAHALLASTNSTLMTTQSELALRTTHLQMAETEREGNGQGLQELASDLAGLRQDLDAARRAAAMIDVALHFHGNSSLGYNNVGLTPSEPATHISMVFNPSETTGLMLHSSPGGDGQYSVTLRLQNGSLAFATKLGGAEEVELVSTATGVIHEDTWYQLFATREDSSSQLSVSPLQGGVAYPTSLISPSSPLPPSLSPNGTLYLGGSPAHVARGYSGCLDRVVVNNNLIPLLLPDIIEGQPLQLCGPRPPSEVARTLETGVWLLGGGSYVQVVNSLIEGASPLSITLEFRTYSAEGLLLGLFSEDMAQRLAVEVKDGRLSLQFSRDLLTMATAQTVGVVNDGEWHIVEVTVEANTAFLLVDSNEGVNATSTMSIATFSPSSGHLYIGGLPSSLQASIGSSELSLAGCTRNLQISGTPVPLNSSSSHARASFSGCPSEVVSGARFMGEGVAVLRPATDNVYRVSFRFHSTQLASLLLYIGDENSSVSISLYHTMIRVDVPGAVLFSIRDGLNDDAWHSVVLELGNGRMNLTVDDDPTLTTPTMEPPPTIGSDVIVGGATPPISVATTTESFRGCIDQLTINEDLADFSRALSLEGVALYGCRPGATPVTTPLPPPPPPPLPPPPSINPNISVGLDGQEGSFLAFLVASEELTASHLITIQFQTSSPNAMLLYAQGNFDFLALELIRGFLVYTYNLGTGRVIIISNHTYHDGLDHSVSLYRNGRDGTMTIDGGRESVSGASPGNFTSLNIDMEMFFIGGTSLLFPPTNLIRFRTTGEEVPLSLRGCLLSLSVNSVFFNLSSPQASQGSEECLEFYTNLATFSGLGYLQLLDEIRGGIDFSASLEFRTTSCTGLLLYAASSSHPDHVALEIVDGLVRFIFDNGRSPTVVDYLPPSFLCDGEWHSVSIVKEEITGALSVDEAEPVKRVSDVANFVSLDLNSPLYVGGVPDEDSLRSTVVSGQVGESSFEGCIRNVYLSTSRTGPLERDLALATSSSGVTFHTCNP